MARNEELYLAILKGDRANVQAILQNAINLNQDVNELLEETMIPAMREVGERFARNEIYVPEMLISARAMQAGLTLIEPILAKSNHKARGKIAIGTVKGDLHDIGKNLVSMMVEGSGFEVIDLGTDVPPQKFVDAVKEHQPDIVGMSALLTTTTKSMPATLAALTEAGVRDQVKVIIGGAPITDDFAVKIGADGFAADAGSAARAARALMGLA